MVLRKRRKKMEKQIDEVEAGEILKEAKKREEKYFDKNVDFTIEQQNELFQIMRRLNINKFEGLADLVKEVENQDIHEEYISEKMINVVYGWSAGNSLDLIASFLHRMNQYFYDEYEYLCIGYNLDNKKHLCRNCVTEPEEEKGKKIWIDDVKETLEKDNVIMVCDRCKKNMI
jgi:hypothetical protein